MKSMPCLRCGSENLMHNVALRDSYGDMGHMSQPAKVEVHGNPEAWIFKETATGQLSLTVCGNCGHAELQVNNYRELYATYLQSREPRM